MYYTNDKISIYYEKYGQSNNTIVILPGWGNTRLTFTNIIEKLKQNFTIYIIDYPGFGNSPFPEQDLTIYDYANLIIDFFAQENIKKPTIIAHSFGGRITTLLAGYYKEEIEKIILIDSAGIKPKKNIVCWLKEKTYKLLKQIKRLLPKNLKEKYHLKLQQIFGSTDYKNLSINMQKTFKNIINEDLKYYLQYIECETLIIWGEKDILTPVKDGILMNKKIKDSALIIYPNATHYAYLDYPKLTIDIIENFLLQKESAD